MSTPRRAQRASLRVHAWLLLAVALGSCDGCDACGRQQAAQALATLSEVRGSQVQSERQGATSWQETVPGSALRSGDSIRTDATTTAKLTLANGAELQLQPGTTLRFTNSGSGEQGIDLVTGEALLVAGPEELRVRTHVGLAIVRAGSSVRLTRDGTGLHLSVAVGEARFRSAAGAEQRISAGESVRLEVGLAVMNPLEAAAEGGKPAPGPVSVNVHGEGARVRSPGEKTWRSLPAGEQTLPPGSELSLRESATVTVTRGRDRVELIGAGEFRVGGSDSLVEARRGKLKLVAQAQDLELAVPGGWIVARAASDAELSIDEREGNFRVQRGSGSWTPNGEKPQLIAAGQSVRWAHVSITAQGEAAPTEVEHGPAHANFTVRAGESFVVHAPELPIAVGMRFDKACAGEGRVELVGGSARGQGTQQANIALSAGTRSYLVRCVDARGVPGRVVARGNAQVLQDAGTRQLPARAPTSNVDADGHSYTIYYQNQPPDVRLRWPNAPKADSYTLDVDGTLTAIAGPEHVFASGSLSDGVHHLSFSAQQRRSRTASVDVRFDNKTATASLSAPADRGFTPGETVVIEGVALAAWKVSVDGGTIDKVGESRFHGQVVTSSERPDIAVRLAHPRLGTHYYLRRAAQSP